MRPTTTLLAFLLCCSCGGLATAPGDWEWRVVATHDYYGLESQEQVVELVTGPDWWPSHMAAANRFAAEGWELQSSDGSAFDECVLMRRSRSSPQPFEIQCVLHKDFEGGGAAAVQARMDDYFRDGWSLESTSELFLEFRRRL